MGIEVTVPRLPDPGHLAVRKSGKWRLYRIDAPERPGTTVIYPGAFNPLHAGHRRIAQVAQQRTGKPAEFEISVVNVDKPPLSYAEVARRVQQFPPEAIVWLTRAPTFADKSRAFPGCTFLVGADTLMRIADVRYYDHQPDRRSKAIHEIAANGCRFLVFGRLIGARFCSLEQLQLPDDLRALCEAVPAEEFRFDISSTALRARKP